jgi:CRP/FNR family transcriptional regulator, cyclic AMP receptor protein
LPPDKTLARHWRLSSPFIFEKLFCVSNGDGRVTMALDRNVELLEQVPIISGLSQELIKSIALKGKKVFFEAGAKIVAAGATGKTAYLVLSGRVSSRPPSESRLEREYLESGVLIGDLAMLVETTYPMDVVAEDRVRALAIERSDLFSLMETDPGIALHFSEKITERLIFLARDLREVDARFAVLEASLDEALAMVG